MAWDPSLLRKYNSTSHFRLLNQLRGELKDQPIQRPLVTTRQESTRRSARTMDTGQRMEAGQRRRQAPAAASGSSQDTAPTFDPIVTVPLLLDAFPSEHG